MTAVATKPRKKTKKTAKAAVKKVTKKKPKWVLVNYKQIEARRDELGMSKSAMSALLGVTNSTYHNWRRGTTVPHESQQEKLLKALHAGPSMVAKVAPKVTKKVAKKTKASKKAAGKKTKAGKKAASTKSKTGSKAATTAAQDSSPFGSEAFLSGGSQPSDDESGQSQTRVVAAKVQTLDTIHRRATVASIVVAFVQANKTSATGVIKLTEELSRILP